MSCNAVVELVVHAELLGVRFRIVGDRVKAGVPDDPEAEAIVQQLRGDRQALLELLRQREAIPKMPPGVRLVEWLPKPAPVMITRWAVVIDVPTFVRSTLRQLEHALAWEAGDKKRRWLAGNWSVRELIDRLEQCGVVVKVESKSCTSG